MNGRIEWHKDRKYLIETLADDNYLAAPLKDDTLENAAATEIALLILMCQHYVTDSGDKKPVTKNPCGWRQNLNVEYEQALELYPDEIQLNAEKQFGRHLEGFSHIYESIIHQQRQYLDVPRHFLNGAATRRVARPTLSDELPPFKIHFRIVMGPAGRWWSRSTAACTPAQFSFCTRTSEHG